MAKRIKLAYGQELVDGFTPHSTRHTAGTLLVRVTDLKTAGELLGHSDKRMTMLYTHTDEKRKRGAVEDLCDVLHARKS